MWLGRHLAAYGVLCSLTVDLEQKLGKVAKVHTLHDYCRELLGHGPKTTGVRRYVELTRLIKRDWEYLKGSAAPQFSNNMRRCSLSKEHWDFYCKRANYYKAFGDDDSVYRALQELKTPGVKVPSYRLVMVDEFQDFNKMEAEFIELLAAHSKIVIAGDDDQALYGQLRGASWEHIRDRAASGSTYKSFSLPFCSRCPEVVVSAVDDILNEAARQNTLMGRVSKPFIYFDNGTRKNDPHIDVVTSELQGSAHNAFGKHIAAILQAEKNKPSPEVAQAQKDNEPVALVIGSLARVNEVRSYLAKAGLPSVSSDAKTKPRTEAYDILATDPKSNLGWRIVVDEEYGDKAAQPVRLAVRHKKPLVDVINQAMRKKIEAEVKAWKSRTTAPSGAKKAAAGLDFRIECVSVERSKGKAAPYVFLVGLSTASKKPATINDLAICRFLVALTRTRAKCSILLANKIAGAGRPIAQTPFPAISWIARKRTRAIAAK